ncbi:uncharacterized protein LOC128558112 [Mercenaria mercenaria]|uniref:uncharacterized protein LOC128558112 n=1 Tax=Mercenaria mercenaria TaxID=6596 RepID=UPI00234F6A78|nr:uncharacterized protein LOC128558112 [Mercenaria mercenaria]
MNVESTTRNELLLILSKTCNSSPIHITITTASGVKQIIYFILQSASQVYTFDELDAEEESVLPVEPVMKRPRYTVCYKPSSESDLDLDDSREDPDWKEEKEEVTDDEDEADGDDNELNQAFISVKDWNPMNVQLKIEIPEKLQGNDQPPAESFMESEHQERELESVEENQSEINKSRPRRSASAKTDLMPGSEVIGLFRNGGRNKWEEWCECKVVDVLMNGELYNVVFTDGAKRFLKKTQIKKKD